MSSSTWWYIARSSGLVAWAFLFGTLVLGTLASGKLVAKKGARRWLLDLHPYLSGLAVLLIVLHVVAIIMDTTISFSWVDAVVPFASSWRPVAIAWSVIALWLIAAIQITSLARNRLPRRIWLRIHLTSYAVCALVTLHAVTAGTDLVDPLVAYSVAAVVTFSIVLSVLRMAKAHRPASVPPAAAPAPREAILVADVPAAEPAHLPAPAKGRSSGSAPPPPPRRQRSREELMGLVPSSRG